MILCPNYKEVCACK